MKVKALLLSMTMLISVLGTSIFGLKGDTARAAKLGDGTEASTTEEEVREDASHAGETTEEATTEQTPKVEPVKDEKTDPEVDTTKGKFKITIKPEKEGWYNEKAKIKVKVENQSTATVPIKISKIEAKRGADGTWEDITDDLELEINENCTVYVKITDSFDNEYEKSKLIKCFDTVAPTLNAAVNEGLLTVMTYDTESGVDSVYVNGYEYEPDKNGIVSIRLEKFDATYQNFYVYALDKANNASDVYTIENPYWVDPNAKEDDENEETSNPSESLPDNASPQTTGESKAEVTSVTNEDGEDITNEVKGKQFYSIITADGQQYFLVIDMTAAQTKSSDTENTAFAGEGSESKNMSPNNGTVYFLTSVSNQNLLNFTNTGEQTLPHNSVAKSNSIDSSTVTPVAKGKEKEEATEDSTVNDAEEIQKEDKGEEKSGTLIYFVIFGAVAVVVIGAKVLGGKKGKPDQNDDSLYGEEYDEEEAPLSDLNEEEEDVE